MRLIDADSLETHEQLEPFGDGNYEYVEVVYKDDIDNALTFEPEPKKGKWIKNNGDVEEPFYHCSVCGWDAYTMWDYCPKCGADMRGEEE